MKVYSHLTLQRLLIDKWVMAWPIIIPRMSTTHVLKEKYYMIVSDEMRKARLNVGDQYNPRILDYESV